MRKNIGMRCAVTWQSRCRMTGGNVQIGFACAYLKISVDLEILPHLFPSFLADKALTLEGL